MKKVVAVIPARWASTRFPGKILTPLCGKPLIQWVWERALEARRLDEVLVATDDERIREAVEGFGGKAIMTKADHPSGTDRIAEATTRIETEAVINIQGDEPLIAPELIDQLATVIVDSDQWDMATAAQHMSDESLIQAPSVVKVVCDETGRALYFSRCPIPYIRDAQTGGLGNSLYLRHIGIYAYRASFLQKLIATPPSPLEQAEKLEQLRALQIGARINVLITRHTGLGVDEPDDVPRAEEALRQTGRVET